MFLSVSNVIEPNLSQIGPNDVAKRPLMHRLYKHRSKHKLKMGRNLHPVTEMKRFECAEAAQERVHVPGSVTCETRVKKTKPNPPVPAIFLHGLAGITSKPGPPDEIMFLQLFIKICTMLVVHGAAPLPPLQIICMVSQKASRSVFLSGKYGGPKCK